MKNAKTLSNHLIFLNRRSSLGEMIKTPYTIPVLKKGKTWNIEYYFNGIRYRLSEGINRIKDLTKREEQATILIANILDDLKNGYNPEKPEEFYIKLFGKDIFLDEAIQKFLEFHTKWNSRKKTIQSYDSKLKYFNLYFNGKRLKEITTENLEDYFFYKINTTETISCVNKEGILKTIKTTKWSQKSVKGAKAIFNAFFNWCLTKKYVDENPFKYFSKNVKSDKVTDEKHVPFTKEHAAAIMKRLDETDKFGALFCRFIYGTCMRPAELRAIQLKHINIHNKTLFIPLASMKNTKAIKDELIDLDDNLIEELKKLNIADYPKEYFLFSNSKSIIGDKQVGVNTPYNKVISALKNLELNELGYDLYSYKHYSNIVRINHGWTLAQIMKRNRHTSVATTEIYLRMLTKTTTISHLSVPAI